MDDVWTLVRFLHVLAVTLWIGGMLFLGAVAVPVASAQGGADATRRLIRATARRFAPLAGAAWVVIVVTGMGLIDHRGLSVSDLPDSDYGQRVLAKLIIMLGLGVLAVLHGLWQGPRVRRAQEAGDAAAARRWQIIGGVLDATMLIGSLVALWLAVSLVA
jgi:uncharacterized membrane protein